MSSFGRTYIVAILTYTIANGADVQARCSVQDGDTLLCSLQMMALSFVSNDNRRQLMRQFGGCKWRSSGWRFGDNERVCGFQVLPGVPIRLEGPNVGVYVGPTNQKNPIPGRNPNRPSCDLMGLMWTVWG